MITIRTHKSRLSVRWDYFKANKAKVETDRESLTRVCY
jgi:hypothetical protein